MSRTLNDDPFWSDESDEYEPVKVIEFDNIDEESNGQQDVWDPEGVFLTEIFHARLPPELKDEIFSYLFLHNPNPRTQRVDMYRNVESVLAFMIAPPNFLKPGFVYRDFAQEAVAYLYANFKHVVEHKGEVRFEKWWGQRVSVSSVEQYLSTDSFGVGITPQDCKIKQLEVWFTISPNRYVTITDELCLLAGLRQSLAHNFHLSIVFHGREVIKLGLLMNLFEAAVPAVERFGDASMESGVLMVCQYGAETDIKKCPDWPMYNTKGAVTSVEVRWSWCYGELEANVTRGLRVGWNEWSKTLGDLLGRVSDCNALVIPTLKLING
jgi:hypothetical protein